MAMKVHASSIADQISYKVDDFFSDMIVTVIAPMKHFVKKKLFFIFI